MKAWTTVLVGVAVLCTSHLGGVNAGCGAAAGDGSAQAASVSVKLPMSSGVWESVPSVADIPENPITSVSLHHGLLELPKSIKRVVVWGDMHGDDSAFTEILAMAGIAEITATEAQKHQDTLFVTTGDYMDRGDSDLEIFRKLVEMKHAGFNMYTIVGNHENMVATGQWQYRDLSYAYGDSRVLELDKQNTLGCRGKFNTFVRDHSTPVLYLGHPAHDQKLLMMHGGISMSAILGIQTSDLGFWARGVNQKYQEAAKITCEAYDEKKFLFKPIPNPYTWAARSRMTSGRFETGSRVLNELINVFERRWRVCSGEQCDPTWDRSFKNDCAGGRCAVIGRMNTEFDDIADDASTYPKVRMVIGHSIVESPSHWCSNHVFGIDTAASNMMGWPPGLRTLMVFDNFGSSDYATNPKMTVYFRKSDMYSREGKLFLAGATHMRVVDFNGDGTVSKERRCEERSYKDC